MHWAAIERYADIWDACRRAYHGPDRVTKHFQLGRYEESFAAAGRTGSFAADHRRSMGVANKPTACRCRGNA